MKAKDVIEELAQTLANRGADYVSMYENHERIAVIWTVILGKEVTADQVALCMAGVKMARLIQSPNHNDSWLDLAGYAAVGAECADERQQDDS